jgi:hypothetical protein
MIEAKAFRIFTGIYSLFKSERLSASIKLTLHNALIRFPGGTSLGLSGGHLPFKIAAPTKQGSPHH